VRIKYGSEAVTYAAPEALDADGSNDPRSDIYAVGVMLWEGLAGRRLYEETAPARLLVRQREGELAPPPIHPSSPFARLADVALRALSFDPSLRYRGATEMAADLRKIVGTKLATGAAVAARVADLAGDRIRMRRALLEPAMSGTRRRASDRSIVAGEEAQDTGVAEPMVEVDLGIQSTEHLIVAALATTTAQMRAVAVERARTIPALPETSTPGDFVIPIDVTETWNESAPRHRRRFATVAVLATIVLVAMGGFLAMRPRTAATGATPMPAVASPPGPAMPVPTGAAGADANAASTASASATATPVTPSSATVRPAPRMAGPTPPPPPAKPKKSIYEPDGL
jgi:serine/threonine-protein kinase